MVKVVQVHLILSVFITKVKFVFKCQSLLIKISILILLELLNRYFIDLQFNLIFIVFTPACFKLKHKTFITLIEKLINN